MAKSIPIIKQIKRIDLVYDSQTTLLTGFQAKDILSGMLGCIQSSNSSSGKQEIFITVQYIILVNSYKYFINNKKSRVKN